MLSGKPRAFFDKSWKAELLLLLVSAIIYFVYFHYIFFNLNSSMSSITNDTLKNYYTYAYQIKNGHSLLHFQGMNYPFGEHVVYTDCQPLLCWILMPLKFTHGHLIGILHALILISFILTPLVVRRVLLRLSLREIIAWPCALGLALLSPQFLKMNAGHFALSYTIVVPLGILLVLRYTSGFRTGALVTLIFYNLVLFSLHPYLGFGMAIFVFFTLLIFSFFSANKKKAALGSILALVIPLSVFKTFMFLTDHHPGRTEEPYGMDVMVENTGSLFAPEFGPFKSIMEAITPQRTGHFEGHTYLGIANILLLLLLPFVVLLAKKRNLQPGTETAEHKIRDTERITSAFLLSSLVLLFIAFGWHLPVMKWLGIKSASANQFRAVCRFAWFFYYAFGIFLIKTIGERVAATRNLYAGTALYLFLSLTEAHFFFQRDKDAFWNWRNLFNKEQLTEEEKKLLSFIDAKKPQALIPVPLFHGGTELYDRPGSFASMIPSMLYSYHSGLPIVSMLASRTSIPETEDVISLVNTYKKSPLPEGTNNSPFLVMKTPGPYLPDEDRLWSRSDLIYRSDSIEYAVISAGQLRTPILDSSQRNIGNKQFFNDTLTGIYYIKKGTFRSFTGASMKDMEHVMSIRKNQFPAGRYIVSLHYYYADRTWQSFACSLILARDGEGNGEWLTNMGIKTLSGFYNGFGVMEAYIDLEKDKGYSLIIYGNRDIEYRVSDLMVRPAGLSIVTADSSEINNFSRR